MLSSRVFIFRSLPPPPSLPAPPPPPSQIFSPSSAPSHVPPPPPFSSPAVYLMLVSRVWCTVKVRFVWAYAHVRFLVVVIIAPESSKHLNTVRGHKWQQSQQSNTQSQHKHNSIPSHKAWNQDFLIPKDRSLQAPSFGIHERVWNAKIRG